MGKLDELLKDARGSIEASIGVGIARLSPSRRVGRPTPSGPGPAPGRDEGARTRR